MLACPANKPAGYNGNLGDFLEVRGCLQITFLNHKNTGEGLEHLPCGYRIEHMTPSQQLAFEHLAAKDISRVEVGKQTKTELAGN